MIRGGWQLIPISESAAFFHENIKLNHLATNPIWALGHNVKQGLEADETRYFFYDDEVAEEKVAALYTTVALTDTSSILNCTKPNIVVVMIESFTADLINALGGDKQTAPQLEKIIQEGLLFSNIFSSGERTDQAFVSVLSGFPAQPERSIMRFPDKTRKLPSLPDELSKVGYTTSFYYGGELGFSNLNSYLINCRFGSIVGIDAFERNQLNSKWGAHDAFVLARQLHDLNTMKEPFFSFLMTLTSHEPYETPIPTPFTGSDPASKFRGSAWYTDKSIGEWFEKAKQQPWFNHTLFVFVADHGHILPKNRSYYDISVRHIPLLLAGGALKEEYRNQKIDGIGNQHDLAATVLSQLRISTEKFVWSSNLLNPRRTHFAYLCMDDAVGWVSDSCTFVYQLQHRNFLSRMPAACSADTLTAKSYVQKLMRDFVNY
jgi:phosphoglycerol transferase MdoB-like AlkP superfamily enzyme